MIDIYSTASSSFDTSKNGSELGGGEVAEMEPHLSGELEVTETAMVEATNEANESAMDKESSGCQGAPVRQGLTEGQLVRIVMPGGSLDGIEVKVLSQIVNALGLPV